ncbi:unnamed protein product [Miscanthus lutarioriparius]|uniref:Rx N-terminal domain-containing protein n=1 Tax=Miscanthus lutarioriparius TaxID=422564 RepID=A0A811QG46_9POAL|nr:unnamed protein product [Miscanthus lutarioriparius]
MAELAAGAVGSLLGVLRAEAQLLRRVGNDVEFIKEEMESMNSFLEHLARTAPPDGSHDEQVQTWMNQVRELAHDCSNCIDHYLLRGDPAIHRARGGLKGYFWWAYWFVQELIAKNIAATRLRELKERAGDVGKRRLRYGVEIPGKPATPGGATSSSTLMLSSSSSSQAVAALPAAAEDDDEDEDVKHQAGAVAEHYSYYHHLALEPPSLDNYFIEKICNWVARLRTNAEPMRSIAIVVPEDTDYITVSEVHYPSDKLGPNKVLLFILRVCRLQKQHSDDKKWKEEKVTSRFDVWSNGRKEKRRIRQQFERGVEGKIKELKNKIEDMESKISVKMKMVGSNKNEATEGGNQITVTEEFKANFDSKIKELENKIKDMESKINEKTGGGHVTGGTEGNIKNVEEKGGSNNVTQQTVGAKANNNGATQGVNNIVEQLSVTNTARPLGALYLALLVLCKEERNEQETKDVLESDEQKIIKKTAMKLAQYMKSEGVNLRDSQYEHILQELFLISASNPAPAPAPATLGDQQTKEIRDQIKEIIICVIKEDILAVTQSTKSRVPGEQKPGEDQIASAIQYTKDKIPEMELKIKQQMMIKWIVDQINELLDDKDNLLIVLHDENRRRGPKWEDIMNAVKLLKCAKGSAMIVTTRDSQKAKEFCYPPTEPITYSLVGLYHDIVLKLTQQRVNNEDVNSTQIFRDILDKCHPHEFCMKMFAGALYANPNRSNKELERLSECLQVQDPASPENTLAINAKKIFKFSYRDLSREHKTCLLYLAIFSQGDNIRRSTLIGRWLTERLIRKEDWSIAVRHAEQCFDALIDRCLVCPGDISAKGEFKSCMVGHLVHGFITKMAKKQHILDPRLSHLLARHFSIFSGLRLRASDTIEKFVKELHNYSPQLSLLKLLDLQGCLCFDDKNYYLKAICNNIPFLKYLSLRETNITHLPREINNLHDLEILDIRQTCVPPKETRHVLLLKLRRLLAGDTNSSASSNGTGITNRKQKSVCSCVSIPFKIEKMENLEVLSNVMASSHGNELKDISKLWQLRKLGVVINDNDTHLLNLLEAIGDLKECLQSVSITIAETRKEETFTEPKLLTDRIYSGLVQPPKLLESVSINGRTNRVRILSLLGKGSSELAKVVLSGTMLEQRNLKVLDSIPKLRCIRLCHFAYNDPQLTFKKEEFEHLKCLLIDGPNMTDINFVKGAAVALEKIVLSSTNIKYLYGVGHLPKLKELELKGNELFDSFSDGEAAAQKTTEPVSASEDRAAPQKNTQLVSLPEDGGVPQNQTQVASPPDDGAVSQKNTESVQLPEDGATSKKKTELVSPSEVGEAPQKSTGLVSPSEDGAALQKNTEINITFKKEEFQHLKYFHFEDRRIINIIFETEATPELEKIILYMASTESKLTVSGNLPKLREIEVKGDKTIFLSLFNNADKINKVTLSDTILNKGDDIYKLLLKKQSMCCLELLDNSYDEDELTFDKDEFGNLNLLIIKCFKIRKINFHSRSCPNLEKIIWFYNGSDPQDEIQISGMENIGKLKELELNADSVPRQLRKDIKAHKNKPVLTHKKPPHKDDKAHEEKQDDVSCFQHFTTSYFSKKKDQH